MSQGEDQINSALEGTHKLAEACKGKADEVSKRLETVATTLEELSTKVFIKTKHAVVHTSAIAKSVEELLDMGVGEKPDANFIEELERLEQETEILKLKVANRDIVIT